MKLVKAMSKRIKEIIKQKGITQYELYKLSGVPQSTISTILKGDIKTIKFSTLYDICAGLQMEFVEFFETDYFKLKNIVD
ncbi:MAG: helix-turn-helix transcriptional regulator [Clostridiales bacterium]|nr:helix-turn-helix transcriptional regulator [Clostridiales bacterium]